VDVDKNTHGTINGPKKTIQWVYSNKGRKDHDKHEKGDCTNDGVMKCIEGMFFLGQKKEIAWESNLYTKEKADQRQT